MPERFHRHPLLQEVSPDIEDELTPQQAFEIYSLSQEIALQNLRNVHRSATLIKQHGGDLFVTDEAAKRVKGRRKTTYQVLPCKDLTLLGLKTNVEFYDPINPDGEPHLFDTFRRITYSYDENRYLIRQVDMEMGALGHDIRLSYRVISTGERVLDKISGQRIGRLGVMTPGRPIGGLEIRDFSEFHPDYPGDEKM